MRVETYLARPTCGKECPLDLLRDEKVASLGGLQPSSGEAFTAIAALGRAWAFNVAHDRVQAPGLDYQGTHMLVRLLGGACRQRYISNECVKPPPQQHQTISLAVTQVHDRAGRLSFQSIAHQVRALPDLTEPMAGISLFANTGVLSAVFATEGGRAEAPRPLTKSIERVDVQFDEPLPPGEERTLGYHVTYTEAASDSRVARVTAGSHALQRASVIVVLPSDEPIGRVWETACADTLYGRRWRRTQQAVPEPYSDPGGSAEAVVQLHQADLQPCTGIGFQWGDPTLRSPNNVVVIT